HVRRMHRLDGADFWNRHLPLGEDLEYECFEFLVASINLVNEEDRRLVRTTDRIEQRTTQEEVLGEDLALLRLHIATGALAELDVQELLLIVPLVQRGGSVEPLVTLQAHEVRAEHS